MEAIDILKHNAKAWDAEVGRGNRWTVPVTSEQIREAGDGRWNIVLTPTKPVPDSWFPEVRGCRVLCLASGGGQQGPILAAAGAEVTVLDVSERQLAQDRMVADRDSLAITTIRGDMANLSMFDDSSFDLIVHPCSNCFLPDVRPVWREAYRVLGGRGLLLSGFSNGIVYTLDQGLMEQGQLVIKHGLPYSDVESLSERERKRFIAESEAFEFGHTLTDQIGGQLEAGFIITGLLEDVSPEDKLSALVPTFVATRAVKRGE